jgi:6-pyruvoyltetrahydropterin/6-carboxytetrahydropterin synthase
MLSRHPERCRFPHGHTRKIEVVVAGEELDEHDMLVDFKALKLAAQNHIERYDHAMAVNSADPLLPTLRQMYPEDAIVVYEDEEPTTEAMAREIYDHLAGILKGGFEAAAPGGATYRIAPDRVRLERVRVWETPTSWAEYGL